VVAPADVAAVGAELDHLGISHRPIGAVVPATGSERVRIG
jgi:phosphoribosylformylglycinamidine cyclo-ligase